VVRIAITQAAFEAIARSLPLGNVSFENKTDEQGQRLISLDRAVVDRLRAMRGPGESYSDVILRLSSSARRIGRRPDTPDGFAPASGFRRFHQSSARQVRR
jgi:peptidoglycan/xylan/chitin deacetylase (PgdA/CDA1 family)